MGWSFVLFDPAHLFCLRVRTFWSAPDKIKYASFFLCIAVEFKQLKHNVSKGATELERRCHGKKQGRVLAREGNEKERSGERVV